MMNCFLLSTVLACVTNLAFPTLPPVCLLCHCYEVYENRFAVCKDMSLLLLGEESDFHGLTHIVLRNVTMQGNCAPFRGKSLSVLDLQGTSETDTMMMTSMAAAVIHIQKWIRT